jgi:ABC-type transport system involved in cytochrome c biogenesis permease component
MAKEIQATVSSGPSMWLRLIAWFYKLGGFLFFVMAVLALVGYAAGMRPSSGDTSFGVALLSLSAMSAALLLTGVLLARRSRAGALMALILSLYPWAFVLTGQRPVHWTDVVITVVTVTVIERIWPQLYPSRASTPAQ